jgi:hypothetical protein
MELYDAGIALQQVLRILLKIASVIGFVLITGAILGALVVLTAPLWVPIVALLLLRRRQQQKKG